MLQNPHIISTRTYILNGISSRYAHIHLTSSRESCIITLYTYISTRIMYDDFNLDYTCEDNSFNYDDEFYEDLDENYAREHTDYQELAYAHYA